MLGAELGRASGRASAPAAKGPAADEDRSGSRRDEARHATAG
jgi:hypothetical protein